MSPQELAAQIGTPTHQPLPTVPNTDHYAHLCPKHSRKGHNAKQKGALGYYQFCLQQEDRYCGSVFYVPGGPREKELLAKSKAASEHCKSLGIAHP
jgi:hypothetical protein